MVELDERLRTLAQRVQGKAHVADIGADHGQLACYLLETQAQMHMTVSDISAPSLKKAERLLLRRGLMPRATLCVCDGLAGLPEATQEGAVDAIVIAGMGAKTIRAILQSGRSKIGEAKLVLQPNLDVPRLRTYLASDGFVITDEQALCAAGRHYMILEARQGHMPLPDARDAFLGTVLQTKRDAATREYYAWQHAVRMRKLTQILGSGRDSKRMEENAREMQQEVAWLEGVL